MTGPEIVAIVIVVAVVIGCIGFDLMEAGRFRGWDR